MLQGVYQARKQNGQIYYRASFHFKGKHISLGSFDTEAKAHQAYLDANFFSKDFLWTIDNYTDFKTNLSFDKIISILNYRDHNMYIKTPIYLENGYFRYYLTRKDYLKFDNDDLFYYSSHKIICRQGHMFVNDYGMQYNINARYGIKNFAVIQRDYTFANGDIHDYRYSNIIVINKYHGVSSITENGLTRYQAKLHLRGDYMIGKYSTEAKAAVAYNKAVDVAVSAGYQKNFIQNYITEYSPKEYADVYTNIKLSKRFLEHMSNYDNSL